MNHMHGQTHRWTWEDGIHKPQDAQEVNSGILSYYWPNATYVHCRNTPCTPITLPASIYEHRLPRELWQHSVIDGKIIIPCGKPVECAGSIFHGPFGPLAVNGSYNIGYDALFKQVEWHPTLYKQCRSSGVYAHVVCVIVGAVILLPMGYAALCRKNQSFSKTYGYIRIFGLLLTLLSAIIVSSQQTGSGLENQCQNTGTGVRTPHGVFGWICISMLIMEVVCQKVLYGDFRVGQQVVSYFRYPFYILSKLLAFLPTAVMPLVGFTFSTQTFKLVCIIALTLGCMLSGIWLSCGCYEYSHFVQQELGHMTYAVLWIILAGVSMTYNHPKVSTKYTFAEGALLMFGGCLSIAVITIGTGGGIFWSGRTMDSQLLSSETFMKDLQHTSQAGLWATVGCMGICLSSAGFASGLPFLLATLCHGSMVLLHGHQANPLNLLGHQLHAACMIIAGIMRFTWHMPEFSFFLTLASTLFISSSKCLGEWAHSKNFDAISYYLCFVIGTSMLWGWFVLVCTNTKLALKPKADDFMRSNCFVSEELHNTIIKAKSVRSHQDL